MEVGDDTEKKTDKSNENEYRNGNIHSHAADCDKKLSEIVRVNVDGICNTTVSYGDGDDNPLAREENKGDNNDGKKTENLEEEKKEEEEGQKVAKVDRGGDADREAEMEEEEEETGEMEETEETNRDEILVSVTAAFAECSLPPSSESTGYDARKHCYR